MRVIDSSALVKFFAKEVGRIEVEQLIAEGVTSLDLSIKEVANALWRKVLKDEIKERDAGEILKDLAWSDVVKMRDQKECLIDAFKLAVRNKIPIYDALFVELAKTTKAELVTADGGQALVARKEGIKVKIT